MAPAAAAETGCGCRAQDNDSHDTLTPLSEQQQRGKLLALQTALHSRIQSTSTPTLPQIQWATCPPFNQVNYLNLKMH